MDNANWDALEEGKPTLARVKYTHDAMIDLMIAEPWISQGALARHFGYTESWISIVVNSDAFQNRLAERKGELVDPVITASMEEKFRALTDQSLKILAQKLAQPASVVPDNLALRAAELGAKALGIGGNAPPAAKAPSSDSLSLLAERLLSLNKPVAELPTMKVIEGEVVRVEVDNEK